MIIKLAALLILLYLTGYAPLFHRIQSDFTYLALSQRTTEVASQGNYIYSSYTEMSMFGVSVNEGSTGIMQSNTKYTIHKLERVNIHIYHIPC